MTGCDIAVVGASNIDLISYVPRLPAMGETLHGTEFRMGFGGKGANQAVMAARLGADVSMISKLGDDVFGNQMLENFLENGVDTANVFFTDKAFSGVAPIAVDSSGRNSIIIVTGANDLLSKAEIISAKESIISSKVLICQMEIPLQISVDAMRIAGNAGLISIFNPAPARRDVPDELYSLIDVLCLNETETEIMTGVKVSTQADAENAGRVLMGKGVKEVIITLGGRGSMLISEGSAEYFEADKVEVVDSTGAGDAFIGSLAVFLGKGFGISEAINYANRIAGLSVRGKGTQSSFPFFKDLPPSLKAGLL